MGCGTGAMGVQLLVRFPDGTLLATDIQERFLQGVLSNSENRGLRQDRVSVGLSDITIPAEVELLPGGVTSLESESFDLISVGAVIGYSKDQRETIRALLGLIKPGGLLLNLEMNEQMVGRWTSHRYEYDALPLTEMAALMAEEGCSVSRLPLSIKYFPVNMTRVGLLAVKKRLS